MFTSQKRDPFKDPRFKHPCITSVLLPTVYVLFRCVYSNTCTEATYLAIVVVDRPILPGRRGVLLVSPRSPKQAADSELGRRMGARCVLRGGGGGGGDPAAMRAHSWSSPWPLHALGDCNFIDFCRRRRHLRLCPRQYWRRTIDGY